MESIGDRCRRDRNCDTSNHLRELLRLRQDEAGEGDGNVPSRTLGSVLYAEKRNLSSVHSNRTLLDIIREDSTKQNKKTWKHFKDKLRLKRAGASWTSSVHIPASDVPMQPNNSGSSNSMNNRMMMRRQSTRTPASDPDSIQNPATSQPPMLRSAESSAAQNGGDSAAAMEPPEMASEEEEGMGETADGDGEGGPVRMSLMALLAETEREMGIEGLYDEEEEEEEESGRGNGESGRGEYNNCCVCMVRHKGAALIPCGHTFCRLCSRELWVQRGNCPLCNGYILEILDIF